MMSLRNAFLIRLGAKFLGSRRPHAVMYAGSSFAPLLIVALILLHLNLLVFSDGDADGSVVFVSKLVLLALES
jgi:hypothetical protein